MKRLTSHTKNRPDTVHARPRTATSKRVPVVSRTKTEDSSVCTKCGAVYLRKTWRRGMRDLTGLRSKTVCPACRQLREGEYFGRVTASGRFDPERRAAIVRRVRNVEARAGHTQPERRAIQVEVKPRSLEILTTSQKLAHRIARELEKAFGGRSQYRWTHPDGRLEAKWLPEEV